MTVLLGVSPGATRGDDGPDTVGWQVVFSDKFDGDKVGEHWKVVYGDWSIEDGALKGRLKKKDLASYDYREADIALKGTEIPGTVEVRYETWSPDEVGSEAKFLTEANDGGIIMAFLGIEHPAYKAKGTMALVFKEMGYRSVALRRTPNSLPRCVTRFASSARRTA